MRTDFIGTAGWAVPKAVAGAFPALGTHLERYARVFPAVEIDTSFYRHHKPETYAKWAAQTPPAFRFAVKTPKVATHEHALRAGGDQALHRFLDEVSELGAKLGVVLVQLPPKLAFDGKVAAAFFTRLRDRHAGGLALEPRHPSWFTPAGDSLLADFNLARVAADPAVVPAAAQPAGSSDLRYFRLHGAPTMYYSPYEDAFLQDLRRRLAGGSGSVWVIFDNTALGHAAGDALKLLTGRPHLPAGQLPAELHVGGP